MLCALNIFHPLTIGGKKAYNSYSNLFTIVWLSDIRVLEDRMMERSQIPKKRSFS